MLLQGDKLRALNVFNGTVFWDILKKLNIHKCNPLAEISLQHSNKILIQCILIKQQPRKTKVLVFVYCID